MRTVGSRALPVGGDGAFVVTGRYGWMYWQIADDLDVRVQLADASDALVPTALLVRSRSGGPVKGTHLRQVHLGQLQRALQQEAVRQAVRDAWDSRAAHDFHPDMSTPEQAALMAAAMPLEDPELQSPVPSSSSGRRNDLFYDLVESFYELAARNSRRPAIEVATRYGVPVTTVHRWLKEGRRRRKLRAPAEEERRRQARDEEARVDEGLKRLGLTWDEYFSQHEAGGDDPLGAFTDDDDDGGAHG